MASLYAATVLFLAACLILGFQNIDAGLPEWAPLALVLPGILLLLGAAVWMASETFGSQKTVIEGIDNALARLEKDAAR